MIPLRLNGARELRGGMFIMGGNGGNPGQGASWPRAYRAGRLGRHLLVIALTFSTAAASGASAAPPSLKSRFDEAASRLVADMQADGVSIALVRCEVSSFVSKGSASRGTQQPVTPDTIFEIGSVSKIFTAFLLAKAVEEGKARLADDVRTYLAGNYSNLSWEKGEPVRLGQLVDTTNALPDYLPDPAPIVALPSAEQIPAAARLLRAYDNADFLRDLRTIKLIGRPGTAPRHSNVAAQLLGVIVGRIYGRGFAKALHAKIERPLGMAPGVPGPRRGVVASGYEADGKGPTSYFEGESILPAGGLRYSARDMAKFIQGQLDGRDPAVRLSHTPLFTSPTEQVAFTWVVSEPRPAVRKLRMSGGTFGASSYAELYPSLGYGVVLLANRAGLQDRLQQIADEAFEPELNRGASSGC
jgi:CubicO group peptidase (beta-lactamase class C family)